MVSFSLLHVVDFFLSLSFKLGLLPLAIDRDGISTNSQVHNPDKISSLVKDLVVVIS